MVRVVSLADEVVPKLTTELPRKFVLQLTRAIVEVSGNAASSVICGLDVDGGGGGTGGEPEPPPGTRRTASAHTVFESTTRIVIRAVAPKV
jgi:hypothetical protein